MSRYLFSQASSADNEAILELIAIPMPGLITLAMERAPDYFLGARVQNQEIDIYCCKDSRANDRLAGLFSVGKRKVYLDGRRQWIPYFSDLRIHPDYQHTLVLMRMIQFVQKERILGAGEYAQTVVFSDNAIMQRLIEKSQQQQKRSLNLPSYHQFGEYITHTVAIKRKNLAAISPQIDQTVRKARAEDVSIIQDFHDQLAPQKQFYPQYAFDQLDTVYYSHLRLEDIYLAFRQETLIGMLGVWDQKQFKQTVVVDYQQPLKALRPLANVFAPFHLPKAGTPLNYFSLHSILIQKNQPEVFRSLMNAVLKDYEQREYAYFLCGLDTRDPLNQAFDHMKARRTILGKHFLVSFGRCQLPVPDSVFYLEVGRI
ncbi:MAG: hypothetical protein AAF587_13450 [Bacteroidota bacterium]